MSFGDNTNDAPLQNEGDSIKKNNNAIETPKKEADSKIKDKAPILGVFYFIAVVFTLTMAFLVSWPLLNRTSEVNEIKIALVIPSDSILFDCAMKENISQLNGIIDELNERNQIIDDKYELLLKSRERDSDFIRLISVIAAFIAALLGFLGYRTIKDIQERVESSAKDQAEDTAKQITEENL